MILYVLFCLCFFVFLFMVSLAADQLHNISQPCFVVVAVVVFVLFHSPFCRFFSKNWKYIPIEKRQIIYKFLLTSESENDRRLTRLPGLAGSVRSLISRFSLIELKFAKFALVFGPPPPLPPLPPPPDDALPVAPVVLAPVSLAEGGLVWIGRNADEPELRLIGWIGRIGPVSVWVPMVSRQNQN